jgi:alpha-L-fucosidase
MNTPPPPPPPWWTTARFGLFIHWGVYSVPAGVHHGRRVAGASEWLMHAAKIPVADYKEYAAGFDAASYDADAWVRAALDAGMGYVVITAKHHDGFALFDSKVNDWNAVRGAAAGRDLLRPLVDACRRAGLPIGFYYSQAQDWVNGGAAFGGHWDAAQAGDFDDYLDRVAIPQIRELLTLYGPDVPALLWWDTPADMTPERSDRIAAAVEEIRPGLLQNDRLGTQPGGGHFDTPEQRIPANRPARAWETCMTTNNSWGFNLHDHEWKPAAVLIRQLGEVVSQGGNYLLNIGPRANGTIPQESLDALRAIGAWMRVNGDAIRGASAGPFPHRLPWGFATRRGDTIHLLVEQWPSDGRLAVPLLDAPRRAYLRAAPDQPLPVVPDADGIVLTVPSEAPDPALSVITLEFSSSPRIGFIPPRPRPPVIPQPADGVLTLRAADAEIIGDHLALMTGSDPWLGCWSRGDSHPLWRVTLHLRGPYRIELDYAVPAHRQGTRLELAFGEQRLGLHVHGTGGWEEFVRLDAGVITLEPSDELPVRVLPVTVPLGAVMNLRGLILTPLARD